MVQTWNLRNCYLALLCSNVVFIRVKLRLVFKFWWCCFFVSPCTIFNIGRCFCHRQNWKLNKIAQGDINIFSHFNIRGYVPFSRFFGINRKWHLKSKKYYQIRVQHVRISRKRHLTCLYRTILVLAAILGEKREKSYARFLIKPEVTDRFCWFSIANTGWPKATLCPNLKQIGAKLRPWECRIRKHTKWPPWRHQIEIFKIWEKRQWHIDVRYIMYQN